MRQTNLAGERADYVSAREELRQAETELMRHRERVADLRRRLPLGPVVEDYVFAVVGRVEMRWPSAARAEFSAVARLIDLVGDSAADSAAAQARPGSASASAGPRHAGPPGP